MRGLCFAIVATLGAIGSVIACSSFGADDPSNATPDAMSADATLDGDAAILPEKDGGLPEPTLGRIFVIGGAGPDNASRAEVYIADVRVDGQLSPWRNGPPLGAARAGLTALATPSHLLVMGGESSSPALLDTTEVAEFDGLGLAPWKPGQPLPKPLAFAAGTMTSTHVYLFGGRSFGTVEAGIYKAPYTATKDAPIGSFDSAGMMTEALHHLGVVRHDDRVYVVTGGGTTLESCAGNVYEGKIGSDNKVGFMTSVASIARYDSAVLAHRGFLYVFGGGGCPGDTQSTVSMTTLPASPGLTFKSTTSLPEPLRAPGAAAVGDFVYVISGDNGTLFVPKVQFARINSDGTLGAWSPTTPLPSAVRYHSVVTRVAN